MNELLALFTIYKHPIDYPQAFVARRFLVGGDPPQSVVDAEPYAVALTLEAVRAALPPGLYRMGRAEADEPQIVETWV